MSHPNLSTAGPLVLRSRQDVARVLTLRPPKVGPLLGYLREERNDDHQPCYRQRLFFTIEGNFLDSPSRGLVAWSRIDERAGADERVWQVRHGLGRPDDQPADPRYRLPGDFDPELWAATAKGPVNRLVTGFTTDLAVGSAGRWIIVCLSLSLSVGLDGAGDLDEDGDALPADRLLHLLERLRHERLTAGDADALEAERHEYPDRRAHRSVVLDLGQSAPGAGRDSKPGTGNEPQHAPMPAHPMRFAVGACHYPGTEMDRTRRDRMLDLMRTEQPAFNLLVGDAIYADAAVDVATQRSDQERWADRYTSAFMSRGFARLIGSAPTYFLPDDHEISNDWFAHPDLGRGALAPHEQAARARQNEFAWAFDAMTTFEWWHGPRAAVAQTGRAVLERAALGTEPEAVTGSRTTCGTSTQARRWPATYRWSTPQFGGHPFFLMDTRTERARGWPGVPDQIIAEQQMSAVLDWLLEHRHWPGPKFIVTGSPIAPAPYAVMRDYRSGLFDDAWWGFPRQMRELLAHIALEQIHGVVFIGGDSHLGALATLSAAYTTAQGQSLPPVAVRSVVSSGLFIPLPGVNARPSDYPTADQDPTGHGPAYPYSAASGTVRSRRGTLDGGTLACSLRVHHLHFEEHCAIIEVPGVAPGTSSAGELSLSPNQIPWPVVIFRP